MSPFTCRFIGGPWDGKTVMRDDAPLHLVVPQLGEVRLTATGVEDVVPQRDALYRRRGPVVGGNADYEVVGDV